MNPNPVQMVYLVLQYWCRATDITAKLHFNNEIW